MGEAGGAEPGKPPPVASLERALDQVVDYLGRAEQSSRVRALMIEARRLRNVIGNWRAITPGADVREEMIARVLRLANDAEEEVAVGTPAGGAAGPELGAPPRGTRPPPRGTTPPPRGTPQPARSRPPPDLGDLTLEPEAMPQARGASQPPRGAAPASQQPRPAAVGLRLGTSRSVPPPPAPDLQLDAPPPEQPRAGAMMGLRMRRAEAHAGRADELATLDLAMPAGAGLAGAPTLDLGDLPPIPTPEATPRTPPPRLGEPFGRLPSLQFERVMSPPVGLREAQAAAPEPASAAATPGAARDEAPAHLMRLPSLQFDRPASGEPPSLLIPPPPRTPVDLGGGEPEPELHRARPDGISARAVPLPEGLDAALVMIGDPYSKRADAFRTLRRKLSAGSARTIAVTSASPREGKTTCAINLALALRETARGRILLVEANIRDPKLAAALKLEPPRCFAEQLRRHRDDPLEPWLVLEPAAPAASPRPGEAGAEPAPTATGAGGAQVHVLAVDPRSERPPMLDPVTFSAGMESLKRAGYAYIIVDTPPVLGAMDMSVIGDSVDGIILTGFVRRSTRKSFRLAIEQLKPAPVLGIVLFEV